MQTGWNAKVEENRFIDAGKGAIFSAREVGARRQPPARRVRRAAQPRRRDRDHDRGRRPVRARTRRPRPQPAARARPAAARRRGRSRSRSSASTRAGSTATSLPARQPFRERGESVRERTLPELWRDIRAGVDNKAGSRVPRPAGAGDDPAAAAVAGPAARHGVQARPARARRRLRDPGADPRQPRAAVRREPGRQRPGAAGARRLDAVRRCSACSASGSSAAASPGPATTRCCARWSRSRACSRA